MSKKSVVNYIKTQLQKGYDISTIRDVMLKYGYTNRDIDDAVSQIYHPTIRHEIHLSAATILVIVLIFASIAGAGFFFYYTSSKTPEKLLDLNLEPVTTTVKAGENVVFLKELSNLGSSKRYDVVIKQELIDISKFKIITEKTETRAIETFGSTQTRMLVPEDANAGDYVLRVSVEYDNRKAVATLPIKISAEKEIIEIPVEEQTIGCNDNNPCTEDFAENGACINKPITPCCGNNICEANEQESCDADCPAAKKAVLEVPSTETIDEIKQIAKSEPGKALQRCNLIEVPDLKDSCIAGVAEAQLNREYCMQVSDARIRDLCYSNLAKLVNDNSLCEQISADSRKDACYMTFVLDNKDYSVCVKLTNKHLSQSCESLRQLNELNKQS